MKQICISLLLILSFSIGKSQDFNTLIQQANEVFKTGNFQQSIDLLNRAIQINPKSDSAMALKGDAKYQLKMYNEAAEDFGSASFIRPSYWVYHKKRGDCYFKMFNYQIAEISYSEAIRFDKSQGEVYYFRGICYQNLGNSTKACSDLSQAYALGEQRALKSAVENECEWSKSKIGEVNCPPVTTEITSIIEPKSGASIISKGISIDGCELKLVASNTPLIRKQLSKGEEIEIKILMPKGFCGDTKNMIYYGTGYQLVDSKNFELESYSDIYEEGCGTYYAPNLKYLSINLNFRDIEPGKNYTLKVRYFDKKSKAEVWIEYPFTAI
jgi:tetratricopeptide (TPR) repeat protein